MKCSHYIMRCYSVMIFGWSFPLRSLVKLFYFRILASFGSSRPPLYRFFLEYSRSISFSYDSAPDAGVLYGLIAPALRFPNHIYTYAAFPMTAHKQH